MIALRRQVLLCDVLAPFCSKRLKQVSSDSGNQPQRLSVRHGVDLLFRCCDPKAIVRIGAGMEFRLHGSCFCVSPLRHGVQFIIQWHSSCDLLCWVNLENGHRSAKTETQRAKMFGGSAGKGYPKRTFSRRAAATINTNTFPAGFKGAIT